MKPEAADYLAKARKLLRQAEVVESVGEHDAAGRAAYLAGFHAAQAMIFEREDRVFKTHNGVQSEFGRLVRDDPHFDIELRAFLGRAYNLKAIADYEAGPGSEVSPIQATEAIATAHRFVSTIEELLGR
jgi:uncharacterized protein (UPF0332 family)